MKNVVLWVGNGFTISLVEHIRPHLAFDIRLTQVFPPPPWVRFVRENQNLGAPLWAEGRFVELRHALTAIGNNTLSFQQLSARLATVPPISRSDAGETFSSAAPAVQLRQYLWHLIRCYEREINLRITHDTLCTWPWVRILALLVTKSRLAAVSYNYDIQLEKVLGDMGVAAATNPVRCHKYYVERCGASIPMLKPHGSVSFDTAPIGQDMEAGIRINIFYSRYIAISSNPELWRCPLVPYVVPPGHSADPYFDGLVQTRQVTTQALREADVLVVCGFSAKGPDEIEFRSYLEALPKHVSILHAGCRSQNCDDVATGAGPLLQQCGSAYRFFNTTELNQLESILRKLLD